MNADPFETLTREYDDWFDAHAAWFESEVGALRAILPDRRGRWVEVGVGTGRFARRLGIAEGIEPSRAMAALARARGIRVLPGVAESLPLLDASVDAVFLITTLCFVQDVGRSLAEARRVLAAGGRLVTAILPRDREIGRRVTADSTDVFFRTARLLTVAELHEALARAGFRVEREAATLVDLASPEKVERAWDGSDRGSFVAVRSAVAPQEAGASTQC